MTTDRDAGAPGWTRLELIGAAQAGDRAAFDELVRRTYVDTYTLALRLTANEEDARDVVQDAYLRAWKGIGRFRGDAQFSHVDVPDHRERRLDARRSKRRRQRTEPLDERRRADRDRTSRRQPEAAAESATRLDRARPGASASCRPSCGRSSC